MKKILLQAIIFLSMSTVAFADCEFCADCGPKGRVKCRFDFPCGEVGRIACGAAHPGCQITFGNCTGLQATEVSKSKAACGPKSMRGDSLCVMSSQAGLLIKASPETLKKLAVEVEGLNRQ